MHSFAASGCDSGSVATPPTFKPTSFAQPLRMAEPTVPRLSAFLQGMRHRKRNLRIAKLLLEGHSCCWIHRTTGLPAGTIHKIRRRMVARGVRCACGRSLNHQGSCGERLKHCAVRGRRSRVRGHCRNGHPYTPENRYFYGGVDTCRICQIESKRRAFTRKTGKHVKPRVFAATPPKILSSSRSCSLVEPRQATSQERLAARMEARSLLTCVGRGDTVTSLLQLIRVSQADECKLLDFARQANGDAEFVTSALQFRQLVLEEFGRLSRKPEYAERIATAEREAAQRESARLPFLPNLHECFVQTSV